MPVEKLTGMSYQGGWALQLPVRGAMTVVPHPPYVSAAPPPPQATVFQQASQTPGARVMPGQYVFVMQGPGWLLVPSGSWFATPTVVSPP